MCYSCSTALDTRIMRPARSYMPSVDLSFRHSVSLHTIISSLSHARCALRCAARSCRTQSRCVPLELVRDLPCERLLEQLVRAVWGDREAIASLYSRSSSLSSGACHSIVHSRLKS